MKNLFKNFISTFLALTILCSSFVGVSAQTASADETHIVSTDMTLEEAEDNIEKYLSTNEEMTEKYPEGLFVIEYNSYGVYEGGADPENPEDVYLGMNVYRLGGYSSYAELTFTVSPVVADAEVYPVSQGTVEFEPQQRVGTAKVKIHNDDVRKGDQILMVALIDATVGVISEGSSAIITITDDEPYVESIVSLSVSKAITDANEGCVTVTLKRTNTTAEYCTLVLKTSDGTAKAGVDYSETEAEIIFSPGTTEQTVRIPLLQSDVFYSDTKYFNVELCDLAACHVDGESKIRVDITNKVKEGATKLTEVSGKADIETDYSSALTDSITPIINVNDNIDRKQLLISAVGAANGEAVQAVPDVNLMASSEKWESIVTLSPTDFQQTYSTGSEWKPNTKYSDGNENVLITSKETFDLNLFDCINFKFENDEWGANGNPNTAAGYLKNPSSESEDFFFTKSYVANCSNEDLEWMKENHLYFLVDENNKNVDYLSDGISAELYSHNTGKRFPETAGIEGTKQYLFYMLYDDKGWDDHHFEMGYTTLYRAVIPFSIFDSEYIDEGSLMATSTGVSFNMDGYKWIISVADSHQGGVGVCDNDATESKDRYGFYAGSLLKVEYKILSEESVVPTPKRLSLIDADGNVHNVATHSETECAFTVNLSTLMTNNTSRLQTEYGMTKQEAENHVKNTLDEDGCITSSFALENKLGFKAEYVLQQNVVLDFSSVPQFAEPIISDNGEVESEGNRKERVLSALDGAITFYDSKGNDITPEPQSVDMGNNRVVYPTMDFDYIKVSPISIGPDMMFTSNLYDLDYKNFDSTVEITDETCFQIDESVVFTLYAQGTTYLKPQLSLKSTMISERQEGSDDFTTTYVANKLDSFIPFEYMYSDRGTAPVPSYYTMKVNISKIYLEGTTDSAEKKYKVNVNRTKSNGQESELLFNFDFIGGQTVTDELLVEIYNVSDKFDIKSQSLDTTDPYKPVVKLMSFSDSGYEYVIYIPSVYNYQLEAQGTEDTRYSTIFQGGDGITIELEDYERDTYVEDEENNESVIISYLNINDTQYICPKTPSVVSESDDTSVQTPYFEQQNEFPTYNDNNIVVGLSGMSVDATNTGTFLSTIFKKIAETKDSSKLGTASKVASALAGTTAYCKFNNQQIVLGVKLSIGGGKVKAIDSQQNGSSTTNENSEMFGDLFKETPTPGANAANNAKSLNAGVLKVSGSGSLEGSVQLDYSHIYHKFKFTKVTISVAGTFGASGVIPIAPTGGIFYATVSTSIGCSLSVSYNQVLNYVDKNGVSHYSSYWGDWILTPSASLSAGIGVGISGVLAFEGSIAMAVSFSAKFGAVSFSASQQEFDITTRPTDTDNAKFKKYGTTSTFDGSWQYYDMDDETHGEKMYQDYYYGDTKCESDLVGDTLTIDSTGTSFHLTGIRNNNGGIAKVTIYNSKTDEVIDSALINTYSEKEKRYQTLYYWQMDNYESAEAVSFRVVVEHIENEDTKGKKIALDSYRVFNSEFYLNEDIGSEVTSLVFKLSLAVKFVVGPLDLVIEPAYMQIVLSEDKDTITLGTVGYYKTYDITARTLNQNEDIPVLMASAYTSEEVSDIDYFDTGEYGEQKNLSTLANNVEHTSKTQVINHTRTVNGNSVASDYAFYCKLTNISDTDEAVYALYYAIDGVEQGVVTDDVFVSDFFAFEDENGALNVAVVSNDSTIKSISGKSGEKITIAFADGTEKVIEETSDISLILKANCVKIAVFDNDNNIVVKAIESTSGNDRQENRPVVASYPSGNTVLFYTEDEPTEFKAEYDMNFTGFSDGLNQSVQDITDLMNATYSGRARIYYTLKNSKGEFIAPAFMDLENLIGEEKFKTGFKITSMDAIMKDKDTVCLSFAAEIPYVYVEEEVIEGTLKEIYYCTGTVTDGKVDFSSVVVVDSVLDYKENISDLGFAVEELSPKYYNSETGDIYDDIILSNVQFENAVIGGNNTVVSSDKIEPVLFFHTNSSINYVTYETLNSVMNEEQSDSLSVKVLYNDFFDDYVIAADENGAVSLIYNDTTESGAYTDTLYIVNYDAEHTIWNRPRRLTYSEAFDAVAFENKTETSAVVFDNISAYVDENGKIAVALRSSCLPFSYDYGVTQSDLDTDFAVNMDLADALYVSEDDVYEPLIVTPVLDYDSEDARTDIALLTFENPVTDFDVNSFTLDNDIFIEGSEIEAAFNIVNTGDTVVDGLKASFYYYDLATGTSSSVFATKTLTNVFLAGHSEQVLLSYTVDTAPDNQLLCVRITNSSGRTVYYDSYKDSYLTESDNITYHKINKSAEFVISANKVEIDSNGIMNFAVEVNNIGEIDASDDVVVSCNRYDDSVDNKFKGTLFSFTVEADELLSGASFVYYNDFDVSDMLIDNKLYYSFEISTADTQYSTENDSTNVAFVEQTPDIETSSICLTSNNTVNNISTDGHRIFDLALGDVVEFKNDVISSYFSKSDIRAYEIGSACLSIDNSAKNGTVKIKAVDIPENGEYVKLLLNIRGTTIYKYVYLHITNANTLNLDEFYAESGWTLSEEKHLYAKYYDIISTEINDSQINFSFVGKDLHLYGDFLKSGGSFEITICDKDGNIVEKKFVDTKAEFNDYGMLMFVSKELDFGRYNVNIKAVLDEGEKLSLDYVKYTIDVSGADTSHYPDVNSYTEELDAPLINGRQRQARFSLNFSSEIKLAEGKNLSDIILTFDEYEKNSDGTYTATGNKVTFTAQEITNGKTLVFTSVLSSKPGCVMKYMLADSEISEGYIINVDGKNVKTDIPDYDMVSYVLKESGILSVTVVEDAEMPEGSVHNSVEVKFATIPDVSRLEGTKLMYNTSGSDGAETNIEFEYVGMTDDPRTAVYRAKALTLDKNELEKTFSFTEGIVLNQDNYVLVTADGDYLENDLTTVITDKSDINIVYTKTKAEDTYINIVTTDSGVYPEVLVRFDNAVNADSAFGNAFVTVTRTITDSKGTTTADLVLEASRMEDENTVVFTDDTTLSLPEDSVIEYALKNDAIESYGESTGIVNSYDGIDVVTELSKAETVKFSTVAHIVSAKPYFESGEYSRENNVLCAKVVFNTLMPEEALASATLTVKEYSQQYTEENTRNLNLSFMSAQAVSENGKTYTVATYKYISDNDDITLTRDEVSKRFISAQQLTISGDSLISADGEICYPYVLSREELDVSRISATDAELNLINNGDMGYNLELLVGFDQEIELFADDTGAFAGVDMTSGSNDSTPLTLYLIEESENTLRFVTKQPFYLQADEVTTFTLHDCFYDMYEFIVDSNNIGVSESVKGLASLVSDMTDIGVVTSVHTDIVNISGEGTSVVAEVTYDKMLSAASFEKSEINAIQKIIYEDSQVSNVSIVLTFKELKNDYTALYTAALVVPDNACGAEVILGECIDVYNDAQLFNDVRTLSLSTELPKARKAKVNKPEAIITAIISDKNIIESLNDIYIGVTYSENIIADNLEGITLDVNVKGIEGVTKVTYKAKQIINNNSLAFVCAENISDGLANVVEISLENAKLNVAEDANVYSSITELKVRTDVPDATQSFMTDKSGDVVVPTYPTEPESTSATEISEPLTTSAADTQEATGNTDLKTDKFDVVESGNATNIWCVAALLISVFALIIVFVKKKQAQK